jgi:hypothetical protein
MDKNGFFGEMLEKGQQAVTQGTKNVVSDVAGSVGGQIGIKTDASPDAQGIAQNQGQTNTQNQQQPATEAPQVKAASTEDTLQFVKEFYAPSTELPENPTPEMQQQMQQKDYVETQQKLVNLRHELHKNEYYDPLIAHETKKPEEEEADDSAAKRVEKQEQEEEQEKMELQEKKAKDDQDIATTRAQTKTEANRGAMG